MKIENIINLELILVNNFDQQKDKFLTDFLDNEFAYAKNDVKSLKGVSLMLLDSSKNEFYEFYTTGLKSIRSINVKNSEPLRISTKILKDNELYDVLLSSDSCARFSGNLYKDFGTGEVTILHADISTTYIFGIKFANKLVAILLFFTSKKKLTKKELESLKLISLFTTQALHQVKTSTKILNLQKKIEHLEKHKEDADKRKDDFISVVSHELKTPISIAKNNLWMFKNKYGTQITNEELQYLKSLEHGLYRMQKIVDNMLDLSRIQDNRLELEISEYDLYDLTLQSVRSFREQADKKGLELIYPKKIIAPIETDGTRLQEVIENLISNAIKYTEKGSVAVILEDLGDEYKISVVDTGPGISDHDKVKIFTKFGQASEGLKLSKSGESTGLGLYVAKNFIKQMGGDIGFESELGKGSTFWVKIPKVYNQKGARRTIKKSKSFFIFNDK